MKQLLTTGLTGLLIICLYACRDENNLAGGKWVDSSFTNIYTDSCTVALSTILLDSISTSGDTLTQIGHYKDDVRGDLYCSFFTEYTRPSGSFSENYDYTYDSLTITLYPSGNFLGDTLATQTLTIYRLSDVIDLDSDDKYNTSTTPHESHPLTSFTFTPRHASRDVIEKRLPDELGQELFTRMRNGDMVFTSDDYFRSYFKGLAFYSDRDDKCINGFLVNDSSFCINLHYRRLEATTTDEVITIKPSTTYNFNKIEHNRTGTPFGALESGKENALPSAKSDNMVYMQAMSGIYVNIEFPYLNTLREQGDIVSIESAMLYLYPVQKTYGAEAPLTQTLYLYTTDNEYVTDEYSDVQSASLTVDIDFEKETYYGFDITSFLQTNLGTSGQSRQKLMLMMPGVQFVNTVDGIFFGDQSHPAGNARLYILYKIYKET